MLACANGQVVGVVLQGLDLLDDAPHSLLTITTPAGVSMCAGCGCGAARAGHATHAEPSQ
jgi:hypothetical protein